MFLRTAAREFFKKPQKQALKPAPAVLAIPEGGASGRPVDTERLQNLARPREHRDHQETMEASDREQREVDAARMQELAMPRRRPEPEEAAQSDAERAAHRNFDRSRMSELAMPRCVLEPPPLQPS